MNDNNNNKSAKNFVISSFQKNEALVYTDNSNNFETWPVHSALIEGEIVFKANSMENMKQGKRGTVTASTRKISTNYSKNNIKSTSSYARNNNNYNDEVEPNLPPPNPTPLPIPPSNTTSLRAPLIQKAVAQRRAIESNRKSMESSPSSSNHDEDLNSNNIGFNSILSKAEGLLSELNCLVPKPTFNKYKKNSNNSNNNNSSSSNINQNNIEKNKCFGLDGHPGQRIFSYPSTTNSNNNISPPKIVLGVPSDTDCNLTQIDWLLRGVGEAYDDEPDFDDDTVDKILRLGGNPPSQLQFPSLYASTQRTMEKLLKSTRLCINFTNFNVYSVKYGIRRDCTHIMLRGPIGTKYSPNEPNYHLIPLPEIDVRSNEKLLIDSKVKAAGNGNKSGQLRDFFVGSVLLNKSINIPIDLNDKVIKQWIAGKRDGSLRLELCSYLISPNAPAPKTSQKLKLIGLASSITTEPIVFGFVDIPLGGLLGTEELDAVVTCEIESDVSTHSLVEGRMNRLPYSNQIKSTIPLGPKLGSISARISLHSDKDLTNSLAKSTPPIAFMPNSNLVTKIDSLDSSIKDEDEIIDTDNMHSAMEYVPTEASSVLYDIEKKSNSSIVSVVIYNVVKISTNVIFGNESLKNIENNLLKFASLFISYKISHNEREEFVCNSLILGGESENPVISADISSFKIQNVENSKLWLPPLFEIWCQLHDVDSDRDRGEESSKLYPINTTKRLVGLAKFPTDACFGDVVKIPIINMSSLSSVGEINVSLYMNKDKIKLERSSFNATRTVSIQQSYQTLYYNKVDSNAEETYSEIATEILTSNVDNKFNLHVPLSTYIELNDDINSIAIKPIIQLENEVIIDEKEILLQVNNLRDSLESILSIDSLSEIIDEVDLQDEDKKEEEKEEKKEEKEEKIIQIQIEKEIELYNDENINNTSINIENSNKIIENITTKKMKNIHILDISIEDAANDINSPNEFTLGYFVTYSLPTLIDLVNDTNDTLISISNESNNIWWDSECAVLNGRCRHIYECNKSVDTKHIINKFIEFQILNSDDGNLSPNSIVIATAYLDMAKLIEIVSLSGCTCSINLPIQMDSALFGIDKYILSENPTLHLLINHRIELSYASDVIYDQVKNKINFSNIEKDIDIESVKDKEIEISNMNSLAIENYLLEATRSPNIEDSTLLNNPFITVDKKGDIGISVKIEEVSHLDKDILNINDGHLFCSCVVGYGNDIVGLDNNTYTPGSESFITSVKSIKLTKWDDENEIYIHSIPSIDNNIIHSPLKQFKNLCLVISVYVRHDWKIPTSTSIMSHKDSPHLQIGDQLIGTSVIDLSTIAFGMPYIRGWYYIYDSLMQVKGQIFLTAKHISLIVESNEDKEEEDKIVPLTHINEEDIHFIDKDSFDHLKKSLYYLEQSRLDLLSRHSPLLDSLNEDHLVVNDVASVGEEILDSESDHNCSIFDSNENSNENSSSNEEDEEIVSEIQVLYKINDVYLLEEVVVEEEEEEEEEEVLEEVLEETVEEEEKEDSQVYSDLDQDQIVRHDDEYYYTRDEEELTLSFASTPTREAYRHRRGIITLSQHEQELSIGTSLGGYSLMDEVDELSIETSNIMSSNENIIFDQDSNMNYIDVIDDNENIEYGGDRSNLANSIDTDSENNEIIQQVSNSEILIENTNNYTNTQVLDVLPHGTILSDTWTSINSFEVSDSFNIQQNNNQVNNQNSDISSKSDLVSMNSSVHSSISLTSELTIEGDLSAEDIIAENIYTNEYNNDNDGKIISEDSSSDSILHSKLLPESILSDNILVDKSLDSIDNSLDENSVDIKQEEELLNSSSSLSYEIEAENKDKEIIINKSYDDDDDDNDDDDYVLVSNIIGENQNIQEIQEKISLIKPIEVKTSFTDQSNVVSTTKDIEPDTPITAKIKQVVHDEVDKILFTSKLIAHNKPSIVDNNNNDMEIKININSINQPILEKNNPIDVVIDISKSKIPSVEEIVTKTKQKSSKNLLSRVHMLALSKGREAQMNIPLKQAGKQRQFIDAETDRVSKIMMGQVLSGN